jgi:hypothetical protein
MQSKEKSGTTRRAGATNVRISCDRADRFQQFCWSSHSAALDRRACRGTRRAAIDEDFGGLDVRSIVGRQEQHDPGAALSGKLVLAAKPEVFLRFQLRHPEQMAEHVELVTPRQPGKIG